MGQFEQLDQLLETQDGMLRTAQVVSAGISKPVFYDYVHSRELERVAHGIYLSKDAWVDAMYLLHLRCAQSIFSHETALLFHDLTDREHLAYSVTVRTGYFKMFTPYLIMTKSDIESEGITFDVAKMDEAFQSGKGYYEMVAANGESSCVFRFNIEAFRNNYGIADLTKMNLVYYGVKVGSVDISLLDISNEFNGEKITTINSAFDIEENTVYKNVVDVYDIMLAGIEL